MKSRLLLFIALCLVLAAGAVWWLHWTRPAPAIPTSASSQHTTHNSQLPITPSHPAKPAVVAIRAPSVADLDFETLSPSVRAVVDARANIRDRLAGAKKLPATLAEPDLQALSAFLLERNALDSDQYGQALKNYVMDALCELNPPPPQLGDWLAQLYHDRGQDEVLRDYAIQHLATYYEQLGTATSIDPQARQGAETQVQGILWEALSEIDSSIAGTALLGLTRLSDGRPEIDQKQVAAAALQLAGDAATGELTRITALQVCARLDVTNALPLVAQAVQQGETLSVRISAVGALGLLGGAEQTSLLDSLANGPEELLKLPARQALKQIQTREQLAAATPGKS